MAKKICLFGLSANPPGIHHRKIVQCLAKQFDLVVVLPCGPRPDKATTNDIPPLHRAIMTDITFGDIPNVLIDLNDLEKPTFTRTIDLVKRYSNQGEVWLAVGTDLINGGSTGHSVIQRKWHEGKELWRTAKFKIIVRYRVRLDDSDLPPHGEYVSKYSNGLEGSSGEIRNRVFHHEPFKSLVVSRVADHIKRYRLYQGMLPNLNQQLAITDPRLLIVVDERNPKAIDLAAKFKPMLEPFEDSNNPNLIVDFGGDGYKLEVISELWRLRVPFLGINAGHEGFFQNDPDSITNIRKALCNLTLSQSPLLYTEVISTDGSVRNALAINDCWVEKKNAGQTVWIQVKVNGVERISKLVSDGVLISTAAGSTAYARAMGATPLYKGANQLLLVGNNVAWPNWRSANLPHDAEIEFVSLDPERRPLQAIADGKPLGEVRTMLTRISRVAAVELAFLPTHDMNKKVLGIQFPED